MLLLYKFLTSLSSPFLSLLLLWRQSLGKEHIERVYERQGMPSLERPDGPLVWIHAASVGEAQSALILIKTLSQTRSDLNFLVTSGTVTSADLMAQRLPDNAMHQFYPLDHPTWVERFLDHWNPDLVLWMESELWPNMLAGIKEKNIPAALVNARLSDRSFKRWSYFKDSAKEILSTFSIILAQTPNDKNHYAALGAASVFVTDNLKYSAAPLPFNAEDLQTLRETTEARPVWLYASTHAGEETLAARLHQELLSQYPDLLTIIVPRHPKRRDEISKELNVMGLKTQFRGTNKTLPAPDTQIYTADTLGELGLFYSLSPIALIGRSFSDDGGGGHNPIEAAQLDCAVITGPNIQYQRQLFAQMFAAHAAVQVHTEAECLEQLKTYLGNKDALAKAIQNAKTFSQSKNDIIIRVMEKIIPLLPHNNKGMR